MISEYRGSFLTLSHAGVYDAHGRHRFLAFRRRAIDCVRHFHPLRDPTERAEPAVEMRSIANQNEKMRGGAIRFVAAGHRNNSAHVSYVAWLVRETTRHSRCQLCAPLLAGGKIPALNHKIFYDSSEGCCVQSAGRRQIEKAAHRLWRLPGQHFDHNRTLLRLERHALRGHLLNRGAVKGIGLWPWSIDRSGICFLQRFGGWRWVLSAC